MPSTSIFSTMRMLHSHFMDLLVLVMPGRFKCFRLPQIESMKSFRGRSGSRIVV